MPSTSEIFCCYAREDQPMLLKLKKHLLPLQRQGLITLWSDIDLDAGDPWETVLHQHLESADIILLLISPDFLASDYCYSTEMSRALQRHEAGSACVIPILLRSAYWKVAPFAKLQMMPKDALPLQNWQYEDDALSSITEEICGIVEKRNKQKASLEQKIQQTLASNPSPEPVLAHEQPTQPIVSIAQESHATEQPKKAKDPIPTTTIATPVAVSATPATSIPSTIPAKPASVPGTSTPSVTANPVQTVLTPASTTSPAPVATPAKLASMPVAVAPSARSASTFFPTKLISHQVLSGHTSLVRNLAFSSNGKMLASSSKDNLIKLWRLSSGYNTQTLEGHTDRVQSLALNANGNFLASSSNDGAIKIWKLSSPNKDQDTITLNGPANSVATRLALSPNNKLLVSAGYNHPITIWEFPSGKQLNAIHKYTGSVMDLAINPDGQSLAVALKNKIVRFWEIPSGSPLQPLVEHTNVVTCVAISPDSTLLVSVSKDQTIKISKFPACNSVRTFQHTNTVICIAISPDSRVLAGGSENGTITFWELPTGRLLHTFSGHAGVVRTLAFSPDNTLLASGGGDNTIKLWKMLA